MTDNPEAMLPVTQEDEIVESGSSTYSEIAVRFRGDYHERRARHFRCALNRIARSRHRTHSTTDKDARIAELEAALEFYADVRTYQHPPTGGLAVRAKPIFCDRGDRARQALKGQSK